MSAFTRHRVLVRLAACFGSLAGCSRAGLELPLLLHDSGGYLGDAAVGGGTSDAGDEDAGDDEDSGAGKDSGAGVGKDSGVSTDSATQTSDSSSPGTTDADADAGQESDSSVPAYMLCAQGVSGPDNGVFLNAAGILPGAMLTLAQTGDVLTATYLTGAVQSLTFNPTTGTSAALSPMAGQLLPGFAGLCVLGPGDEFTFPATFSSTAGTLTYDRGAVFLAVDGTLQGDGGACGPESTAASYWILCGADGGLPPFEADDASPPMVPQLPVGPYACVSEMGSEDGNDFSGGGGTGVLDLAQVAGEVTAVYSGDTFIAGTVRATPTSATTAIGEPNGSLTALCLAPAGPGGPGGSGTLLLSTASIAVAGPTVFVSFAGTMAASSPCGGTIVAGALICNSPPMK